MRSLDSKIARLALWTYNLSIALAFVVMVGIGVKGLEEIISGLVISALHRSAEDVGQPTFAIGSILEGFEFLLLAPLAFVIIVSIGNYLQVLLQHGDSSLAEHQIHRVKAMIISLMISIVATDLVKRFVGEQREMKFDALIFGGTLMILLSLYFVVLLRIHRIDAHRPE